MFTPRKNITNQWLFQVKKVASFFSVKEQKVRKVGCRVIISIPMQRPRAPAISCLCDRHTWAVVNQSPLVRFFGITPAYGKLEIWQVTGSVLTQVASYKKAPLFKYKVLIFGA